MGEEGGSSPKQKKQIHKPLQNTVVVNTVGEGEGFEQQQKGSPWKRKRQIESPRGGPQISPSCSEDKDAGCIPMPQPLPGCSDQNVQEGGMHGEEGPGCAEKRMRGTAKKATLQTVEEDAPRQVGVDECESEGDLACDKSLSLDGESGQEGDDNGRARKKLLQVQAAARQKSPSTKRAARRQRGP